MDIAKQSFVEALMRTFGNISQACKMVGISRRTFYNWRDSDPEFKNLIESDEFIQERKDYLEELLYDRAKKSDAVLIFLAKTQLRDRGYIETSNIDLKTIPINWIEEKYSTNEIDGKTNDGVK